MSRTTIFTILLCLLPSAVAYGQDNTTDSTRKADLIARYHAYVSKKLSERKEKGNTGNTPVKLTTFELIDDFSADSIAPVKLPPLPAEWERREKVVEKTIELTNRKFQIKIVDNGYVDDDTISVYFNREIKVLKKKLTAEYQTFDLEWNNTGDNQLWMVAENEGTIPPNTALVVVIADGVRHEITLTANLKRNAGIAFKLKAR